MSIAVSRPAYPLVGGYLDTLAASDLAGRVVLRLREVREHLGEVATRRDRIDAFDELSRIYEECGRDNWDGEGASAIPRDAYVEAARVLEHLPTNFPTPDVVADPSGAIGLEWHVRKNRVYVASVRGEAKITYGGIFGEENMTHGTESYVDVIPPMLIVHLRRLYGNG